MIQRINNALLRVEDVAGEPPLAFERPVRGHNTWVLELRHLNASFAEWCAQTAHILGDHAEVLRQARFAGGHLFLFVECNADGTKVFSIEATFLRLLADLGITLEIYPVPPDVPEPKHRTAAELYGSLAGMATIHGDIVSPLDLEWDAEK